ncbi:MAG: hypothetical protein PHT27_04170 [Candidatus Izemoplasmatales bacterium]|nr:hypothetical protein [Candidatus Izemoplasmatales bacterium]
MYKPLLSEEIFIKLHASLYFTIVSLINISLLVEFKRLVHEQILAMKFY